MSESPKAAMTLISAAFTNSTGAKGESKEGDKREEVNVKFQLLDSRLVWDGWSDPDRPEEGMEGEGLMSGHWNT